MKTATSPAWLKIDPDRCTWCGMAADHPLVASVNQLNAIRSELWRYWQGNPSDMAGAFVQFVAATFMRSQSQLFQDLLVLFLLKGKPNGYFVEFGATDGVLLSNTIALERNLNWKGMLAEPARGWHTALKSNRKAAIDLRCVWSKTGEQLDFKETADAELSTLTQLVDADFNKGARVHGTSYNVETVSLNDLLKTHQAPREIDYMSIDTEGSELPILEAFDFARYDVKVMTVEHNFVEPARGKMHELLTRNGFVRVFEPLSQFDDWYVKRALVGL